MKFTFVPAVAAALAFVGVQSASAEIITYDVTNYEGGVHGVWTNDAFSDATWSFQPGATFVFDTDAGTGTLSGSVINNLGVLTPLELELSGLLGTLDGTDFTYKGGGGPYDPTVQDYFTSASGTFDYSGFSSPYTLNDADPFAGRTTAQFGIGANDKDPGLGLSAWLNFLTPDGQSQRHWDVNASLARRPTDVPEPAPIALLALGLSGIVFARRRKRKMATA